MTTISVDLPDELREFVAAKVKQGRFSGPDEYILSLVESARVGHSGLEAALIEGLQSGPAEEWTSKEWDEIRQRVIARHAGE